MPKPFRFVIFACFSIMFLIFSGVDASEIQAASFKVTPAVLDLKALPRDIIKESLTLKNNGSRKLDIYASVENVAAETGEREFLDPSRADYSISLANWIEISRGVIELWPGEEKTIDFRIALNSRAKPGIYHAAILFNAGRPEERQTLAVNLEVLEDIKERLQLKSFAPEKNFFTAGSPKFLWTLENIGNRILVPSGELIIYDKAGKEIASAPLNPEKISIAPGTLGEFANVWESAGKAGRFKAVLQLEYGSENPKVIRDTIFFWILPWKKIAGAFGTGAILSIILALLWHRKYEEGRSESVLLHALLHHKRRGRVVDLRK